MLEIPESHTIARQLRERVLGRRIEQVKANASPHKFAWFWGDPAAYPLLLTGRVLTCARALGGLVEIETESISLTVGDGAKLRLFAAGEKLPSKHQLHLLLDDGSSLVCTVQMYGSIWACPPQMDGNSYYQAARDKPSPLSGAFDAAYFEGLLRSVGPSLSAKAFLATQQRIPGLGNGVLQDILFQAGIHPKRKLETLSDSQLEKLFDCIKECLAVMTQRGGRNTEKDLLGRPGGYETILSSKTLAYPCPVCGGGLVKEAYLGGSVYFCPHCQPEN